MTDITDGTSNTMMVGEQSNHLRDANGNRSYPASPRRSGTATAFTGGPSATNHPTGGGPAGWGDGRALQLHRDPLPDQPEGLAPTPRRGTGHEQRRRDELPDQLRRTPAAPTSRWATGRCGSFTDSLPLLTISTFRHPGSNDIAQE